MLALQVSGTPFETPLRQAQWLLRVSGLGIFILLAACTPAADDDRIAGSKPIACLLPGASDYKPVCTVERAVSPDGAVLTVRAPDGGFRRLLVVKDGRGVIAADGAEPVGVEPAGSDGIDVTAGGIVYRLPAKIAP